MPSANDPQCKRFFNCLAYVMEDQLRDLCLRSMEDYIDYLMDVGVSRVVISQARRLSIYISYVSTIRRISPIFLDRSDILIINIITSSSTQTVAST